MPAYYHRFVNGDTFPFGVGKVVCVGRNYAEHARELGNEVPDAPILFHKPATAVVPMAGPLVLPQGLGACHHELELAVLIGARLCNAEQSRVSTAVAGYGLGLDLTLRDLQNSLKDKGQPWERAKAFDGACPLSSFIPARNVDWRQLQLRLYRNTTLQQQGDCKDMLFPVEALLAEISCQFTLLPGDVVLTGTPPGVGPLHSGDVLRLELGDLLRISSSVQ